MRKKEKYIANIYWETFANLRICFTQKGNNCHQFVNERDIFVIKKCASRQIICFRKKICEYECTNLIFCETVNCFIDMLNFFRNLKQLDDFAETEFRTCKSKIKRIFAIFCIFRESPFRFNPIK
jgi:hypothetical protein